MTRLLLTLLLGSVAGMTDDEYRQSVGVFAHVIERLMHQSFELIDEIESFSQVTVPEWIYLRGMGLEAVIKEARETETEALPIVDRFVHEPLPSEQTVEELRADFKKLFSFMPKVADFLYLVYQRILPRTQTLRSLKVKTRRIWLDWLRIGRTATWLECTLDAATCENFAEAQTAFLHILRIIHGSLDTLMLTDGLAAVEGLPASLESKSEEAKRNRAMLLSMIGVNIAATITGNLPSATNIIVSLRSFARLLKAILQELPMTHQYGDFKFTLIRGGLDLKIAEYEYLADELVAFIDENLLQTT